MERAYGFETLITRGRAFIGVAGVNSAIQPQAFTQAVQFCQFQPLAPPCAQLRAVMVEWAPYVLAIFMSTFPIG
jgi:hypothetical protein